MSAEEVRSQSNLRPMTIDDRPAVELALSAPVLTGGDYFIHLYALSRERIPSRRGRFDLRVLRDPD